MPTLEKYYRILELEPGASLEEVNQGYKDMVLVWHPDRFVNHPRLQQKALVKIQEINEARERLQSAAQKAQTVKVPTKSTTRVSSRARVKSNVNNYDKPTATKQKDRQIMDEYIPFIYPNKFETCVWLD
jgi:DnaJ-class molecular chaperone